MNMKVAEQSLGGTMQHAFAPDGTRVWRCYLASSTRDCALQQIFVLIVSKETNIVLGGGGSRNGP